MRSMGSQERNVLRKRLPSIRTKRSSGDGSEEEMKAGKEEGEPLSPAARLFHEPHFNCYIIAIIGSGRRIDVDVVKAGLEVTLLRHPRFSSVQVLGSEQPRWVRTKVELDHHLVIPDMEVLSSSSPSSSPDQVVEDYIASLSRSGNLDPSRPLWDLHLLNLPTSHAEATAVFRVHHSLGDGTSLVSLVLACSRQVSHADSLPTLPTSRRSANKPRPGPCALLRSLWALLAFAWHTLIDILLFFATVLFLKDTQTPFKGAEGVEFQPKRFVHHTVSLEDVKAIKNAMHCTINDVLVGITSAGFSRYLSRKYDRSANQKNKKKSLPRNIRMRSTLLVNIRPTAGIRALADMMEEKGEAEWGNRLGYLILPFPIVINEDPLDYVRQGRAIADRKKNSLEAFFTYGYASFIVKFFGIKAAAALSHRVLSHTTLSFSNIVGPAEEIAFCGHPCVYLAPSVYGHPHALTVHFQSYMNKLTMVLAVDELAIPDPHQLMEDLTESLNLIKDAAKKRS